MQVGQELIQEVRAGFIKKGSTLAAYCKKEKIDNSNAHKALRGSWSGSAANSLTEQLVHASGAIINKVKSEIEPEKVGQNDSER